MTTPIKDKFGNIVAGHYRGNNGCIQINDESALEEYNKQKNLQVRISGLENSVKDIFTLLEEIKTLVMKDN